MSNFETNPKILIEDLLNLIFFHNLALLGFRRDVDW